MNRRLEQKAW